MNSGVGSGVLVRVRVLVPVIKPWCCGAVVTGWKQETEFANTAAAAVSTSESATNRTMALIVKLLVESGEGPETKDSKVSLA